MSTPSSPDGGAADGGAAGGYRSGFACLLGRPNTGKSTLLNALVGEKVAITSNKPQTTRHTIRGVVTRPDGQLIVVDTPGLHRPRTLLGQRLNDLVADTLAEVDVLVMCIPADEDSGPGDKFIARQLAQTGTAVVGAVTKTDLVSPSRLAPRLVAAERLLTDCELTDIVPVSALTGAGVEVLQEVLLRRLPEGPVLFPDGELTDEPEVTIVAELIREAALEGLEDELPHSLAVTVEEMLPREGWHGRDAADRLVDVYATLHVERSSQKPIVLGPGGRRLKQVGTDARGQIERLLGTKVYLNLHVSVARDWQRSPKQLRKLGF